jgi:hypothetical protein
MTAGQVDELPFEDSVSVGGDDLSITFTKK